jgi:hypothetical protein
VPVRGGQNNSAELGPAPGRRDAPNGASARPKFGGEAGLRS